MKNLLIKGVSGFALTFVAQAALAAPVTITDTATTGPKILATSRAVWTPSPSVIGTLNAYRRSSIAPIPLTAEGGASATIGLKTNVVTGVVHITDLSFNSPVKSLTFESTDQLIQTEALGGSIKISAPPVSSHVFALGGELIIKDMRVDQATKTIFATVTGANGFGTRTNIPLWTYVQVEGATKLSGSSIRSVLTPIRLTLDGINAWSQALGLKEIGTANLKAVNDGTRGFGDMTITVHTTGTPTQPGDPACTVP